MGYGLGGISGGGSNSFLIFLILILLLFGGLGRGTYYGEQK